jgi:phosphohistidine swiveling domain-containing protein
LLGSREVFDFRGKIVITTEFFMESDLLKEASGFILQNPSIDHFSEEAIAQFSKKYQIPYITRADGAMSLIKEAEVVRLEPALGLVFKEGEMSKKQMLSLNKK